jgi:predicted amidophosphoribosyltransferase
VGIAIVFLLALIVAGVIVYPLLPGRVIAQPAPALNDGDIARAVLALRQRKPEAGRRCPSCGRGYEPGDRFCVGCGQPLSQAHPAEAACPSCGAPIQGDDRFCAKCGETLHAMEGA